MYFKGLYSLELFRVVFLIFENFCFYVSEEGLDENTMQWELIFMGQEAGKVDAAGKQQRTAYK